MSVCVFLLQVSDWWEEYIYLRSRSPIMVNSNFYIMVRHLIALSGGCTSLKVLNVYYFYASNGDSLVPCNKTVINYNMSSLVCV